MYDAAHRWVYVKVGLIVVTFVAAWFGTNQDFDPGIPLPQLAAAVFALGVLGMLMVIGIQAINPRSAAAWSYPQWTANPFSMKQPLQFFYFGGYFTLACGLGMLLQAMSAHAGAPRPAVVLTFFGAGLLAGGWCCTRVFRRKMAPRA